MTIPKVPAYQYLQAYRQNGPNHLWGYQAKHGDLFYTDFRVIEPLYIVLHPQMIYECLVKQVPMLEKSELVLRSLRSSFGDGLFTSHGELWRKQRKLMQPAFQHKNISTYGDAMVKHTLNMLETWQDGQIIQIDEAMHALTFTIVVDALFSTDAVEDTAVVNQAMHDLAQGLSAQSQSLALIRMPDWAPHPILRKKRRGANQLKQLVQEMITEREQLGEDNSPPDLLSTLLFTRDPETGEGMSNQQLQDELITLYVAGHETTAVTLDWIWVSLAQNPDALAKLQEELRQVLNGRPPTVADLPNLPYTRSVVKEALRLYPPVWFFFRQAPANFSLNGDTIPENAILFLFPYMVHRDERWYEDALKFKPERWTTTMEKELPKGAYLPFGMGPRICIGNGFAEMEAQLLVATIAQQVCLEQLDEAIMGQQATLSFVKPVRMKIHRRKLS